MNKYCIIFFSITFLFGCKNNQIESNDVSQKEVSVKDFPEPIFSLVEANKFIELPLHCVCTALCQSKQP